MEDKVKKEKRRDKEVGGPKFRPLHLNSINPKKKKNNKEILFFKVFKYLSKSKFSISHSQCPTFKLKSVVFKKIQTSDFMIKISSHNFQNSKSQNFIF